MKKNDAQINGFAVANKKKLKKKIQKKKKNPSSLFVQIKYSKRCAEIFLK